MLSLLVTSKGVILRQSFITWQVQPDTSTVREAPCSGNLLEVRLAATINSRGTLETGNLIAAGKTQRKGELFTKYVFTEKIKKGLCFRTLPTSSNRDIPSRWCFEPRKMPAKVDTGKQECDQLRARLCDDGLQKCLMQYNRSSILNAWPCSLLGSMHVYHW